MISPSFHTDFEVQKSDSFIILITKIVKEEEYRSSVCSEGQGMSCTASFMLLG